VVIQPPFDVGDEIELDQGITGSGGIGKGYRGIVKSINAYDGNYHIEVDWESGAPCDLVMPQDKAHKVAVLGPELSCYACRSLTRVSSRFCYKCRTAFRNKLPHIPLNDDAVSIIEWALKWHWKRG
jgi:hypothetical protein